MLGFFQKPCSLLLFYHIFSIQCKKKFFSFEKAMGSAPLWYKIKKIPALVSPVEDGRRRDSLTERGRNVIHGKEEYPEKFIL